MRGGTVASLLLVGACWLESGCELVAGIESRSLATSGSGTGGGASAGGSAGAGAATGGASLGCADGTVEQSYGDPSMVGCDGNDSVNQCDAVSLCLSPDWHLCTYDEYLQRGGEETPAAARRWLRSCIRTDGDALGCPNAQVCDPGCNGIDQGSELTIGWDCEGEPVTPTTNHLWLGVFAETAMARRISIGCQATACAHVAAQNVGLLLPGATCCR